MDKQKKVFKLLEKNACMGKRVIIPSPVPCSADHCTCWSPAGSGLLSAMDSSEIALRVYNLYKNFLDYNSAKIVYFDSVQSYLLGRAPIEFLKADCMSRINHSHPPP